MADWRHSWAIVGTRARYYIPVLRWFPKYNFRKDLLSDFSAGLTVALLIIPQSLSYASSLAKLEPIVGLYTCFGSLILYGLLGTSRQLSAGPEALVSLLIGNAVGQPLPNGTIPSLQMRMEQAMLLSLMVGLITLVLGLARFGFVDSVLSRALLRGFITAVACVILIEQLPALLGLGVVLLDEEEGQHNSGSGEADSPFHKLQRVLAHLREINWVTAAISVCSVGFLFGFQRLKRSIYCRLEQLQSAEATLQGPFYRPLPEGDDDDDDEDDVNSKDEEDEEEISKDAHPESSQLPTAKSNSRESLRSRARRSNSHLLMLQSFMQSRLGRPTSAFSNDTSQQTSKRIFYLRFLFYIPEILIVVMCTVLVSWALQLNENHSVAILGDAAMKSGFMIPHFPAMRLASLKSLLTPAILISVLGFVESIVAAKDFASKYNYSVSANRELVAFGVLNVFGSALNAFPAFSSIARSRVNDTAGAKTQMAGVITGLFILLTIAFMLPVFYYLPKAVMASIVLVAATGLLEMHDVWFMIKIRAWRDLALAALTFLITIFWSVEAGTLISISLSLVLVVKHSTTPKISVLGRVVEFDTVEQQPKVKYRPLQEIFSNPAEQKQQLHFMEDQDILVVRVEEALYFGNTGQLKERLRRAEAYGGWLHIHPSEDEQRPATNDGTGTQPADRKTTRSFDRQPINSSPTNSMGRSAIALPSRTPNHVAYSGNDGGNESDALLQRFQSYRPPDLRAVVFDIENMTAIDASAIQILTEIVEDYQRRDIQVFFVKIREVNKSMFLRSGLLGEVLGSDHFFRKISEAIAYLRTINNRHPLQPADGETSSPDGRQSYSTYNVL